MKNEIVDFILYSFSFLFNSLQLSLKIVYLRWNLGDFMAVRQPLFRQGLPLQKTMQNRAGDDA